jgi:hypothetical protein
MLHLHILGVKKLFNFVMCMLIGYLLLRFKSPHYNFPLLARGQQTHIIA